MKYTDLNIQDRQDILRRVQSETGKDLQIIEKDWWVVADIRVDRMSRHIYDICKMANTPIADQAPADKDLYLSVMDHRRTFIGLRGFNYHTLLPQTLNILPPAEVRDAWKKDYQSMQESMIYEESPSFEHLIEKLTELNKRINTLNY